VLIVGKKLEKNGMWESSRMMLPEHKAAALSRDHVQFFQRTKPTLHEDEYEIIAAAIGKSMSGKELVTINTFGNFGDTVHKGVVTKFDQINKRVRIDTEDDWEWIDMRDVVRAVVE
jgi:hypothetical protein